MLEHMRLAKMSFDLWGALSPIGTRQPPGVPETEQNEQSETKENDGSDGREASVKRTMSQAELESSLFKVSALKENVVSLASTFTDY